MCVKMWGKKGEWMIHVVLELEADSTTSSLQNQDRNRDIVSSGRFNQIFVE